MAMTPHWNKYAATAARRHGKPGREVRPKSTTIDIHSHVAIPQAAALVKPHLDPSAVAASHFATDIVKGAGIEVGTVDACDIILVSSGAQSAERQPAKSIPGDLGVLRQG